MQHQGDNLHDSVKSVLSFNEENVEWIANYFLCAMNESRGGALSSKQRIEIFLQFVSDPGFQAGIGKDIGVHRTTVCKTSRKVHSGINPWFPTAFYSDTRQLVKKFFKYDISTSLNLKEYFAVPAPNFVQFVFPLQQLVKVCIKCNLIDENESKIEECIPEQVISDILNRKVDSEIQIIDVSHKCSVYLILDEFL
ncbi:hypothetical protein ANN_04471 [Periplaneta americana]|uniref:Uncharacterized protein n=1 Tax=Periplaneta americana TaxID=6978 RepID=A0ABQ8TAB6_PERAM|nr:hypothetical protein ANN_04471 [Periplaneta americana]